MTSKRKLFGALAFSAALAGGGVAGALLGTPGTSGAQDQTSTTVASSSDSAAHPRRPAVRRAAHALRQDRRAGLEAAAKALDMTPEALRTELRSGKSIADVAKEKDVPVQDVVDAIVAAEKARLEAEIDKLPEQVTNLVNHTPPARPEAPANNG
jgi:hypothetical protein